MTTELATIDGEVIEEQRAPITLFGTDDPVAVVERATTIATALADVIEKRHLFSDISGKKHVQVEGWTLLGSMLGVFAEIEWSRPLDNGWEARAVARTLAGQLVGAAESMCSKSEGRWRTAGDYAVRSMAQTRAVSKALRLPLGFIMQLAGYSATPAEEIGDEQAGPGERTREAESASAATPASPQSFANRGQVQQAIAKAAQERGITFAHIEERAKVLGVKRGDASMDELLRLLRDIRGEAEPDPIDQVLAVTGGTEVIPSAAGTAEQPAAGVLPPAPVPVDPPRPGTDPYKALPVGDKAKARAYWAEKDAEDRQPQPINPEPEPLEMAL